MPWILIRLSEIIEITEHLPYTVKTIWPSEVLFSTSSVLVLNPFPDGAQPELSNPAGILDFCLWKLALPLCWHHGIHPFLATGLCSQISFWQLYSSSLGRYWHQSSCNFAPFVIQSSSTPFLASAAIDPGSDLQVGVGNTLLWDLAASHFTAPYAVANEPSHLVWWLPRISYGFEGLEDSICPPRSALNVIFSMKLSLS